MDRKTFLASLMGATLANKVLGREDTNQIERYDEILGDNVYRSRLDGVFLSGETSTQVQVTSAVDGFAINVDIDGYVVSQCHQIDKFRSGQMVQWDLCKVSGEDNATITEITKCGFARIEDIQIYADAYRDAAKYRIQLRVNQRQRITVNELTYPNDATLSIRHEPREITVKDHV